MLPLILFGAALLPQSAHASMFHGETLDAIANGISWVVLVIAPIIGITVFWLVHVMPEKIAHKKKHPQTHAIHCLCLLSLCFGGLLWPIAWLWAYTKPVMHKLAYGTDQVFPEGHEPAVPADATLRIRDYAAREGWSLSLVDAGEFADPSYRPDAVLINRYEPGTRLSLHQDKDERDAVAPIVSVSLGVPAKFIWGGLRRADSTRRLLLESGDVVVWGGESRFVFHGVAPLPENTHVLTGHQRINLTFRKAH
jgi:alkylated DNA repair dioxygenase AlkB